MSLRELADVLKAPPSPKYPGKPSLWADVESRLGMKLPRDYRDYIAAFGSGEIAGFIVIVSPFHPPSFSTENLDFFQRIQRTCDVHRQFKESEGDEVIPYGIYPETPGLLPWGTDGNGNSYYWFTKGKLDNWPVVVSASDDSDHQEFKCTMTTFLANGLKRALACRIWPDDFPDPSNPKFHNFRQID